MAVSPKEGIQVLIYDQQYNMRGQLDPEYIRMLARFVDERMRSIASRGQTVDSLRAAILAALNIADDYHRLLADYEAIARQVDQELGKCNEALDQLLDSTVQ
ncbi:MAG: cell division protein ZapA [Terriglobia bacterium]